MNEEFKQQLEAKKEELGIKDAPEEVKEEVVSETTEPTIEDKAVQMGWDPNHKGPNYVSAKEFVERGSFFRKIDSQNKKIDELMNVVKELSDHNKKVAQVSYNKGMQDALHRRNEAIDAGDRAAFESAERDINELSKTQVPTTPQKQELPKELLDFKEENKTWLNNQPENARMVKEADGLLYLEMQDNPNASMSDMLVNVKQKIMRLYPEKFENPNKQKPMAVTPSNNVNLSSSKSSGLIDRMTERQKSLFKSAKSMGINMTLEEYAKQLDMIGDLKHD